MISRRRSGCWLLIARGRLPIVRLPACPTQPAATNRRGAQRRLAAAGYRYLNQFLRVTLCNVLQTQHAPGADFSAEPASHARGSRKAFVALRVGSDVNPHLAVLAAKSAGDAHVFFDRNAETSELLHQPQH